MSPLSEAVEAVDNRAVLLEGRHQAEEGLRRKAVPAEAGIQEAGLVPAPAGKVVAGAMGRLPEVINPRVPRLPTPGPKGSLTRPPVIQGGMMGMGVRGTMVAYLRALLWRVLKGQKEACSRHS